MYSRNFYPEQEEPPSLPKNYDGTTFLPKPNEDPPPIDAQDAELEENNDTEQSVSSNGIFASLNRIPVLSGILNGAAFKLPKLGSEELLILAVSALLFFSKKGDKECALILLFLLFIT